MFRACVSRQSSRVCVCVLDGNSEGIDDSVAALTNHFRDGNQSNPFLHSKVTNVRCIPKKDKIPLLLIAARFSPLLRSNVGQRFDFFQFFFFFFFFLENIYQGYRYLYCT